MTEEISAEIIKKTQKSLGKYVKKPPLTEKLLRKPPFRFLHDVIHTVVEETGYLSGLFSEAELVSDNVKDKDAKTAFLDKLIEAVKHTTKTKLTVRSGKIVAGLEPTNTNLLLQAIGKAIDSKIDSSSYVSQLNSGNVKETKKSSLLKEGKSKSSSKEKSVKREKEAVSKPSKLEKSGDGTPKQRKVGDETPKSKKTRNETPNTKKASSSRDSSRNKASSKIKEKKEEAPDNVELVHATNDEILQKENLVINEKEEKSSQEKELSNITGLTKEEKESLNDVVEKNSNEDLGNKGIIEMSETAETFIKAEAVFQNNANPVRPKSARPKSGDKRLVRASNTDSSDQEGRPKALDITATNAVRPQSTLRPPSVRPSSARPGAPRLRPDSALPLQETVTMGNINVIVENVDLADDEETVVIETDTELPKESSSNLEVSGDNRGQLVDQILEQIQEEEGSKKKVEIDWDADAFRNKDATYREVHQLRTFIQNLTKTANPLGKLMNYLHEDVDAMHAELQMWINTKKQLSVEIQKQKKISIEANKPLLAHLDHLRQEISKVKQEIVIAQSNIIRNDVRIKELLSK